MNRGLKKIVEVVEQREGVEGNPKMITKCSFIVNRLLTE